MRSEDKEKSIRMNSTSEACGAPSGPHPDACGRIRRGEKGAENMAVDTMAENAPDRMENMNVHLRDG